MWDLEEYGNPNGEYFMPFRGEFGGGIARKGTVVEGTYKQCAYHDQWDEAHAIRYDGELTPEVCEAIKSAWNKSRINAPESSWGKLRWSNGSSAIRVDVENRLLITSHSVSLCD